MSRSQRMFDALGKIAVHILRNSGEHEAADWFYEQYVQPPYNTWHITASGQPGLSPNNNPVRNTPSLVLIQPQLIHNNGHSFWVFPQ